jgi:hypothetical protein
MVRTSTREPRTTHERTKNMSATDATMPTERSHLAASVHASIPVSSFVRGATLLATLLLVGCLQTTYHVRSDELARLATLPPEDRGERIRSVQELSTRPDTPPADDVELHGPSGIVPLLVAQRIHATRCQLVGCRGVPAPTPTPVRLRATPVGGSSGGSVSSGSGSSSGSSSSSSSGDDSIGAAAILAVIASVAVAAGVVVVAATEGARHDGWIGVSMDHPIHLYTDDGHWISIPAFALEPELAEWADGAVIDASEGNLAELERAPLNRRGLTLGFEGTLLGLEDGYGGGSRLSAGGFPHRLFGLQLFVDFALRDPLALVRYGAEASVFAPGLARLHLGAYVQAGNAVYRDAALDRRTPGFFVSGGGLVQIELTTRLALQLSGGVWAGHGDVRPEFGLGLAVY